MLLKTLKLRMIPVAFGITSQHGLRQQRFTPQRDQALPVKIPWMESPQPHCNVTLHYRTGMTARTEDPTARFVHVQKKNTRGKELPRVVSFNKNQKTVSIALTATNAFGSLGNCLGGLAGPQAARGLSGAPHL